MALKIIRRGDINEEELSRLLDDLVDKKITDKEVANIAKIPVHRVDELRQLKMKERESVSKVNYKIGKKGRDPEKYDMDVQKMISYKGIIRPMTLDVKNASGGSYKLRVINIYVKPDFTNEKTGKTKENTRYYEEQVYRINKGDIAKGTESNHYYPDKANWSKIVERPQKPQNPNSVAKTIKPSTLPDTIQLRRKRLKRIKLHRKPISRCKCRTTKKR